MVQVSDLRSAQTVPGVVAKTREDDLYNKHKAEGRKVVLAAFINEAKLTKAGANTYFANLKKKLG